MATDTDGRVIGSTSARIGLHIGGFMEMPMGTNWTFRPELLYSMQGSTSEGGRYIEKFDYINLPSSIQVAFLATAYESGLWSAIRIYD